MNAANLLQRTVNCVKVSFPTRSVSTIASRLLQTLQSNFTLKSANTCSFRSSMICLASTTSSAPSTVYFLNMSNTTSCSTGRVTLVLCTTMTSSTSTYSTAVTSALEVMEKRNSPLSLASMKDGITTYSPALSNTSTVRSLSKPKNFCRAT